MMPLKCESDKIDIILPLLQSVIKSMSAGIAKDTSGKFSKYVPIEKLLVFVDEHIEKFPSLTLRLYHVPYDKDVFLCAQLQDNNSFQFVSSHYYLYTCGIASVDDMQKMGGCTTFATRYILRTLFRIPMFDGNDPDRKSSANQSSNNNTNNNQQQAPQKKEYPKKEGTISKEQAVDLLKAAGGSVDLVKEVAQEFGVKVSYHILEEDYENALEFARLLVLKKGK